MTQKPDPISDAELQRAGFGFLALSWVIMTAAILKFLLDGTLGTAGMRLLVLGGSWWIFHTFYAVAALVRRGHPSTARGLYWLGALSLLAGALLAIFGRE